MQKKTIVTKTVAAAVAFSMAFTLATGINVDAAKKAPKLNKSKLTLDEGATFKLKVVKNKNKISKVTWKSTKAAVAKVSKKGLVTAKKAGNATIKAIFKVKGAKKKTTLKCKVTVNKKAPAIVGAWETAENPTVPEDVKKLAEQFLQYRTSPEVITLTPYALLATKVVSGTGYRVLCRADLGKDEKTGQDHSSFSILDLYKDAEGNLDEEASGLLAYMDDFASSMVGLASTATPSAGSYVQFDDPVIPAERKAAFDEFFAARGIQFPYKPIARLTHRESTGKYEVCLVCEREITSSGNVGTDEPIGYFAIKVELDATQKHVANAPMIFPFSFTETNYSVCVEDMKSVDVETQAAWIRCYIMGAYSGDKDAIGNLADKVSYPIEIGDTKVNTKDEFKALFDTKKMSEDFIMGIRKAVCLQMSANYQGIMLGDGGEVWLNQDQTDKTQIKITAFNGLFA